MGVIIERELTGFELSSSSSSKPTAGSTIQSFTLETSSDSLYPGFTYTLDFPLANAVRVLLTGPNRPRPAHDNVILPIKPVDFKLVKLEGKHAVFDFPTTSAGDEFDGSKRKRELRLDWVECLVLDVWESIDGEMVRICGDIPSRSHALTANGMMRHWWLQPNNIHLGLGEKAAPIDLTHRNFTLHGTDAAHYDAYEGDPMYKHTPYLISSPRPKAGQQPSSIPSTYAIYHASNSGATWDIGRTRDDPWGYFKRFEQDWGGLEEWTIVGKSAKEVTRTWAEMVGRPKLVGRDWLGYLASGMGLGESDSPPAQELLANWPELCKKYDIPCSAIHFSSGYTTGDDGKRYVFGMNQKRYPDFKGLVSGLHKAGIKVVPNIKPYVLDSHPAFQHLYDSSALFTHSAQPKPVVTRIWSAAAGSTDRGSWVDMSSPEGRAWWEAGAKSLMELGCDGLWNDNNEFYLHDDEFICRNELGAKIASSSEGPTKLGLMGRMFLTEMMGKVSHDAIVESHPERRPFVLTRSGNVGTFKYACSTWSGDNETCWKTLRGSQHIQLNSGLSLMTSYGSDVGGFCGPLPSPEMFVRWVQLGVTHSRFSIHSFKPDDRDESGVAQTNLPWMYPEVLPIIRDAIKWRYEYLPFFNSLMWASHLEAEPTNTWLGHGAFFSDPVCFTDKVIHGFNAWVGTGQLLTVPAVFEGDLERDVYFPQAGGEGDDSIYWDLNAPFGQYQAGKWETIKTPMEHIGMFGREGAVIPVGKDHHTVTQEKGIGRTTPDGVDVLLDGEGGVVGLDDFRAIRIFPRSQEGKTYKGSWIEDDGISADPSKTIISVTYSSGEKEIEVEAKFEENGFKTLWGNKLYVILPQGDERKVKGEKEVVEKDGKRMHLIEVVA